jgi:hypothetical protein
MTVVTVVQLAASLCGALLAWVVWQLRAGRPWDRAHTAADRALAAEVARAVPLVARREHAAVSATALTQVVAFYTRWLDLPAAERDAHGESLRAAGIDMVRLGDSLRWFRDRR